MKQTTKLSSDNRNSRKSKFVLCSTVRTARSMATQDFPAGGMLPLFNELPRRVPFSETLAPVHAS